MKKMLLPILAGFFLITAPYWIGFIHREIETRTMWKEVTEYVLENKDQIEVTETRQIFPYAYTGLAIAGVEYGYYYDAEDQFEMEDDPYRNGYRTDGYPDDPTDWYYTVRICENWFYYEVHDG